MAGSATERLSRREREVSGCWYTALGLRLLFRDRQRCYACGEYYLHPEADSLSFPLILRVTDTRKDQDHVRKHQHHQKH